MRDFSRLSGDKEIGAVAAGNRQEWSQAGKGHLVMNVLSRDMRLLLLHPVTRRLSHVN